LRPDINFAEINSHLAENEQKMRSNDEQMRIFQEITAAIEHPTDHDHRFFISGIAGTGKSFLIQSIRLFCIFRQIPHILTAATGIAASLIKGITFHSAFSLFSDDSSARCSLDLSTLPGLAALRCQVIIVDEITMIAGNILAAVSDRINFLTEQSVADPHENSILLLAKLLFGSET
jgi:hypothetical protein